MTSGSEQRWPLNCNLFLLTTRDSNPDAFRAMTDDFDKLFQRARRHPGRIFVSRVKGRLYGITYTSTCTDRPVCEPIPGRNEIRDMDHADIIKAYQNEIATGGKVDNLARTVAGGTVCHWKTVYNALNNATRSSS